jgi:hypothetical protein
MAPGGNEPVAHPILQPVVAKPIAATGCRVVARQPDAIADFLKCHHRGDLRVIPETLTAFDAFGTVEEGLLPAGTEKPFHTAIR